MATQNTMILSLKQMILEQKIKKGVTGGDTMIFKGAIYQNIEDKRYLQAKFLLFDFHG